MVAAIPLSARTANAVVAYCHYLGKIFSPTNLSPLYPFAATLPTATVAEAAALLVIISIFVIALRRTQPALLFGWLWFLGMLVPVIGLVKIGEQSMADRYTYLPSLGITAALVWSAQTFLRKSPRATLALSGLGLICALACAIVTEHQIKYWHNSETMFQRAVDTTENNTLADVGLGICLAERGQLDAAIALYRHSLIVSPNYFESHYNLGQALSQQGKYDEAIEHFKAAIAQRSGIADTYSSLGVALIGIGRNDDAIAQFQQAARLNPADPLPHDDIAKILSKDDSHLDDAINQFQIALQLQPNNASRHSDLGSLLMRKGRHNEAIAQLQEAVKLDPQNADHHNNLGSALGVTGHLDDAITEFQTAIKLNPTDPRAQKNLARALAMKASAPQNPPLPSK
jgi:tetratricopeptide (TPR) repeat protein